MEGNSSFITDLNILYDSCSCGGGGGGECKKKKHKDALGYLTDSIKKSSSFQQQQQQQNGLASTVLKIGGHLCLSSFLVLF